MATKTFKIGLSNTDKQNMAQDVYERLIAMCFDEYDNTKTYNKGDFVVYENPADTFKLYECNSDNVTGAWDSSKWDLATFQTLIDNIEDADALLETKANVDGNYPTMTVGVADQLSPYDDESGDDQDEPFSFQATGTGNGSQPDFSTGSIALLKEKQGNTVVCNQLLQNPTFTNTSNWSAYNSTRTVSDNILSFTANQQGGGINQTGIKMTSGHKLFVKAEIKTTTATDKIYVNVRNNEKFISPTTNWQTVIYICNADPASSGNIFFEINDARTSDWDAIQVKNVALIDLTQWFNGDIPQDLLDNPSHFFRYYQGSLAYNEGELVNANGRYVKCIGRNQWDEEWELGGIETDGSLYPDTDRIRSKNYIKVVPGVDYYYYRGDNNSMRIVYYDKDKNFISYDSNANTTHTTPKDCLFIKIVIFGTTTYGNNVTISLYYEGESGYDQYYPYEVLNNNDTGTEVLRSAGSVKDYKTPDGTIHRLVGSYTFTGSESWTFNSNGYFESPNIPDANKTGTTYNVVTSNGIIVHGFYRQNDSNGRLRIWLSENSQLTSESNMNTYFSNGSQVFFEKTTPITEQGTPFSENLVIDDFGSMDFAGTNGVPQGNLIFYPVDYKAFIDTLYDYTNGTPSNIALKSDLSSLVSQEDVSDKITMTASFTSVFKKAKKTGNVITISLSGVNTSGSTITATTELFNVDSSIRSSDKDVVGVGEVADSIGEIIINRSSGKMFSRTDIANGKAFIIDLSYVL